MESSLASIFSMLIPKECAVLPATAAVQEKQSSQAASQAPLGITAIFEQEQSDCSQAAPALLLHRESCPDLIFALQPPQEALGTTLFVALSSFLSESKGEAY